MAGLSDKRVEYFDALRGFAMLLVVIGHILFFSLNIADQHGHDFLFLVFNRQLELPLFFLISGYFAVKFGSQGSDAKKLLSNIWRKFTLLVIPPLIFMITYGYVFGKDFIDMLFQSYKGGFWFTFTLFQFVLIYEFVQYIISKIFSKRIYSVVLFILLGIVCLAVSVVAIRVEDHNSMVRLFGIRHFQLFPFYICGGLLRYYRGQWERLLKLKYLWGAVILLWIGGCIYSYSSDSMKYIGSSTLYFFLLTCLGVAVFYRLFEVTPLLGASDSSVGRFLTLCGRRSLDIYFIHYFLLPRNLSPITRFFIENPNPYLEYVFASVIALVVIAGCLIAGKILRLSPVSSRILLAAK